MSPSTSRWPAPLARLLVAARCAVLCPCEHPSTLLFAYQAPTPPSGEAWSLAFRKFSKNNFTATMGGGNLQKSQMARARKEAAAGKEAQGGGGAAGLKARSADASVHAAAIAAREKLHAEREEVRSARRATVTRPSVAPSIERGSHLSLCCLCSLMLSLFSRNSASARRRLPRRRWTGRWRS